MYYEIDDASEIEYRKQYRVKTKTQSNLHLFKIASRLAYVHRVFVVSLTVIAREIIIF